METKAKVEAVETKKTTAKINLPQEVKLKNGIMKSQELMFLLKQTFPTLTQNEFLYAISQCNAYGLDPRKKEIYFVPFKGKNGDTIASVTSYEVYANELENSGYDFITEWKGDDQEDPLKLMVKAKVYYKNSEKLRYQTPWISIREYAKMDYKGNLSLVWKQFPDVMLEKCVLVRCARFVLGKNMGYIAEELYNAKSYGITDQVVNDVNSKPEESKKDIPVKVNIKEIK